jgi:hypothetical protein
MLILIPEPENKNHVRRNFEPDIIRVLQKWMGLIDFG